jgi:hypothetical protein
MIAVHNVAFTKIKIILVMANWFFDESQQILWTQLQNQVFLGFFRRFKQLSDSKTE